MKKHIFRSITLATMAVLLASLVLIFGVLYTYFANTQAKQLETETGLAAAGVEKGGMDYLTSLGTGEYRITWIAGDGKVLFDNKAESGSMENHLEREEIRQALATGHGASSRYSTTLTERQLYYAVKLSDGTVLRLSVSHPAWWTLILGMIRPLLVIGIAAVVLALFLAYRLSDAIVKPLNTLNLDEPKEDPSYEELSPLIHKIQNQQKELKRKQQELNRKKEEFSAATDHMMEGIVLLNESGTVLSINPSASRILGISSFCIGKDLLLFNHSFELQELLRRSATGEHTEITVALEGREYQFNATPIKSDGNVCGIALILFDITEKEKAEETRREFTANVSHELKTPLQNISGYAELLAGGMVKPEDVAGFSKHIYSEAKRMIALVEDIIKLSHLDEGGAGYQAKDTDLYEIVELTHRNLLPVAEGKNITFTVSGTHAVLCGIPELLSEIVYNLCDNAMKYNSDGGSVNAEVKDLGEAVSLSVSDTGIGIPAEEQEHIFERFYRVDKSRSKEVGGTGLGLSIVKHAALIHHAQIEVHSKPGEGTEIRLTFPKAGAVGN